MPGGTHGEKSILLGEIAGAHGLRGEVRLRSHTAPPEAIAGYLPLTDAAGKRVFVIRVRGQARGCLIAAIDGVTTREAAEALRGTGIYAPRASLPDPGEESGFLIADLIGLEVRDAVGASCGRVTAVHDFGAGSILEITAADGIAVRLYSFTEANFPQIEPEKGYLVLTPPEIL